MNDGNATLDAMNTQAVRLKKNERGRGEGKKAKNKKKQKEGEEGEEGEGEGWGEVVTHGRRRRCDVTARSVRNKRRLTERTVHPSIRPSVQKSTHSSKGDPQSTPDQGFAEPGTICAHARVCGCGRVLCLPPSQPHGWGGGMVGREGEGARRAEERCFVGGAC